MINFFTGLNKCLEYAIMATRSAVDVYSIASMSAMGIFELAVIFLPNAVYLNKT